MMRAMNTEEIKHLASLARIRISEADAQALSHDIDSVLEYVSVISDITATGDLTKKVGVRHNVFRADEVSNEPDEYTEDLLAEAPELEGRYLKVKKILNQE